MQGSIRKAVVVLALTAAGGSVPTAATADQWTEGGAPYSGPAHVEGTVTVSAASGASTTCGITVTVQLANTGVPPLGVANASVSTIATTTCSTSLAGCAPTTSFSGLPWAVTTSGSSITTSGIQYTTVYSGGSCPINGVTITTSGSVTGENVAGTEAIWFENALGLSSPLGAVALSGELGVYAEDEAGDPDYGRPIGLT